MSLGRELNQIIYNQIKDDTDWISYTGATAKDPRIYKGRTPAHVQISDSKPAYGVYYRSGSIYSSNVVITAGRNDYVYIVEIYSKDTDTLDEIGYLIERIFREKRFTSTNYIVNLTYASRGSYSWDDARQLFFETVTISLTHILALNESS
ncbi:MAG: hypothetical protein ACFFD1_02005 [Candidatus Thorarchaeota archaeon]